jgi:glutamate N-acetyltransferase/amino-acid N-acetyltransferase
MPAGFAAGGRAAGIKPSGRPDVAMIVATAGLAAVAATFTRNLVSAAPVRLSREHLAATGGRARAVIVTSGSANAATGAPGDADQARIAAYVAAALGCRPDETLAASTGLIGTRLPVDAVGQAIGALVAGGLSPDETGLAAALEAMMTTDSRRKAASATLELPGTDGLARTVRVTGIVKGVGMIHPNMATMIAVVLTDAAVAPGTLDDLLRPAVGSSFDMLTVDGDTSTNDTVFTLASGGSGSAEVLPGAPAAAALGAALAAVCRSLARQQAADGEGASTLLTCRVSGAADATDARAIARAVVGSSLLKAAVHGRDPNWGRAAAAAGAATRPDGSPVGLRPEVLRIALCGTPVFAGQPVVFDAGALSRAMDAPEVVFELDLGVGGASAEAWGCDLTEAYVRENSEYST